MTLLWRMNWNQCAQWRLASRHCGVSAGSIMSTTVVNCRYSLPFISFFHVSTDALLLLFEITAIHKSSVIWFLYFRISKWKRVKKSSLAKTIRILLFTRLQRTQTVCTFSMFHLRCADSETDMENWSVIHRTDRADDIMLLCHISCVILCDVIIVSRLMQRCSGLRKLPCFSVLSYLICDRQTDGCCCRCNSYWILTVIIVIIIMHLLTFLVLTFDSLTVNRTATPISFSSVSWSDSSQYKQWHVLLTKTTIGIHSRVDS